MICEGRFAMSKAAFVLIFIIFFALVQLYSELGSAQDTPIESNLKEGLAADSKYLKPNGFTITPPDSGWRTNEWRINYILSLNDNVKEGAFITLVAYYPKSNIFQNPSGELYRQVVEYNGTPRITFPLLLYEKEPFLGMAYGSITIINFGEEELKEDLPFYGPNVDINLKSANKGNVIGTKECKNNKIIKYSEYIRATKDIDIIGLQITDLARNKKEYLGTESSESYSFGKNNGEYEQIVWGVDEYKDLSQYSCEIDFRPKIGIRA
jgi:hypothetical protein